MYFTVDYTLFGLYFMDPLTPFMCGILSIFGLFTQYLLFVQIFVTFYLFFVLFFCSYSFIQISYLNIDVINELNKNSYIFIYLYFSLLDVFFQKIRNLYYFNLFLQNIVHNEIIESFWTFVPALILLVLAVPTFTLLYASDEIISNPTLVIKVLGNQWFWNYDVTFVSGFLGKLLTYNFDSYISSDYIYRRLLETTECLCISFNSKNLFLVSSTDVIHSWTVPSLGFKVDAIPGRLNASTIFVQSLGTFYGQCSEICGAQHGFMPIELKIFPKYINEMLYDLKIFANYNLNYTSTEVKIKYKMNSEKIIFQLI